MELLDSQHKERSSQPLVFRAYTSRRRRTDQNC